MRRTVCLKYIANDVYVCGKTINLLKLCCPQAMWTEQARQELINQVRVSAAKTLERIRGRQVLQRLVEEAQKKERFEELKQQLELDQEDGSDRSVQSVIRSRCQTRAQSHVEGAEDETR